MHFAFIPYGARTEVERLMRDIESQKFQLPLKMKGQPDKFVWVTGQVRELPFGVKEIVFPREAMGVVLSTMLKKDPNRYLNHIAYKPLMVIFRKAMGLEPVPKDYDSANRYLWDMEYVSIMPLGIRTDSDLDECKDMGYKGWNHESL